MKKSALSTNFCIGGDNKHLCPNGRKLKFILRIGKLVNILFSHPRFDPIFVHFARWRCFHYHTTGLRFKPGHYPFFPWILIIFITATSTSFPSFVRRFFFIRRFSFIRRLFFLALNCNFFLSEKFLFNLFFQWFINTRLQLWNQWG